jgi:uncharacterized OB-fold protein
MPSIPVTRDPASEAYFEGADSGVLRLQRCEVCGHQQYPLPFAAATDRCRSCGAPAPPWVDAAGEGTIVSWTVIHGRAPKDGGPAPVEVAGIVELAEGPWVHATLDPALRDDLTAGLPVVVGFDRPHEDAELRVVFSAA